jgi:hypothetical protein
LCGYNRTVPPPSTADVRQWARSRGYAVGDRGRLSPTLVEAYLADQAGVTTAGPPTSAPATGRTPAKPSGKRPVKQRVDQSDKPTPPKRDAAPAARRVPAPREARPGQRGVVRARSPWNWPQLESAGRTTSSGRGTRRSG